MIFRDDFLNQTNYRLDVLANILLELFSQFRAVGESVDLEKYHRRGICDMFH